MPPEKSEPPYALKSSGYEVVVNFQGVPDMMNEVLGFTIGIHSLRVLGGGEKSGEPSSLTPI